MDLNLDPTGVATIIRAAADITVAGLQNAQLNRATMSQAARDEQDHIQAQMYWDWRAVLQFCKIVGEPMPWPPKAS